MRFNQAGEMKYANTGAQVGRLARGCALFTFYLV